MIAGLVIGFILYFAVFIPDIIEHQRKEKRLKNTETCKNIFKGYVSPEGVNNGNEKN